MKAYSGKVCLKCYRPFIPTAPPQKYCGSYLKQEGCSYLLDLKRHRERMKIVNRRRTLIGRRCGNCRHLLMLHSRGLNCQFGDGKKCPCVRHQKGYNNGVNNPHHRFTTEEVLHIRAIADQKTRAEIAREYGVVPSAISEIVNGRRWKHLLSLAGKVA